MWPSAEMKDGPSVATQNHICCKVQKDRLTNC